MALSQPSQIDTLLSQAKHILVTFPAQANVDAIASATALMHFLRRYRGRVDIVAADFSLPRKLHFLHDAKKIQATLPHIQKFMIRIDLNGSGIEELSYDVKDQQLQIFVTPKNGTLSREQVQTAHSDFRYDVIITINTPELTALGDVYYNHMSLFHNVPVIALDHRADHEQYGAINHIDLTASSTTQIVAELMQKIDESTLTEEVATALLTGMIHKTQSFKSENIKPRTLALASKLVALGADREYIIRHLYQSKSLSMLRLWGEALAHMNYHADLGLVTSTITREDFVRSGATEEELYDIIDELIVNSPEEKMVLLLHEHQTEHHVLGILNVEKPLNAKQLLSAYNPEGDAKQVSFKLQGMSLAQAEQHLVHALRSGR